MKTEIRVVLAALLIGATGCQSTNVFRSLSRKDRDRESTFAAENTSGSKSKSPVSDTPADITQVAASGSASSQSPDRFVALGQGEVNAWYSEREKNPAHLASARQHFDSALRKDPHNVDAHHGLAVVADLQERYTEAEQHYKQALVSRPGDSEILGNLGYSYVLQGRLSEAEQTLKRALQADPGNGNATKNLGDVYARQGKTSQAESQYRKVLTESQMAQALAEARAKSPDGESKPLSVEEEVDRDSSLFSRLRPKQEPKEDATAKILRQMREEAAKNPNSTRPAPSTPYGMAAHGQPAWAQQGMPDGRQPHGMSEQDRLKQQLAIIDAERRQRVPTGPVVLSGPRQGTAPPTAVADGNDRYPPADYQPPAAQSFPSRNSLAAGNAPPVASTPGFTEWTQGAGPAEGQPASAATPRPWGGVEPAAAANSPQAIDQAMHLQQPGQGFGNSPTSYPQSNGSPYYIDSRQATPLQAAAGTSSFPSSQAAPANSYEEAARAAALLGMGMAHSNVAAVPSHATPRQSAGAGSHWNGTSFPEPARSLPTDMPTQDLNRVFAPQQTANMAPTEGTHGQFPASTPPLHNEEQFGTASRFQQEGYRGEYTMTPAGSPLMQMYEAQRQQADAELNQAMQAGWGNRNNNAILHADGQVPTPQSVAPPAWPHRPASINPYDAQPQAPSPGSQTPQQRQFAPGVVVPKPYTSGAGAGGVTRTSYEYEDYAQPLPQPRTSLQPYRGAPASYSYPATQQPASSLPQIMPAR